MINKRTTQYLRKYYSQPINPVTVLKNQTKRVFKESKELIQYVSFKALIFSLLTFIGLLSVVVGSLIVIILSPLSIPILVLFRTVRFYFHYFRGLYKIKRIGVVKFINSHRK